MDKLAPTYSISVDHDNRIVSFRVSGFWELEPVRDLLRDMDAKAAPLVASGRPFDGLGILREMATQTRDVADYLRRHLERSREAGLRRVAIIDPPALVRIQYQRISNGLEVQFFENEAAGRAWLLG